MLIRPAIACVVVALVCACGDLASTDRAVVATSEVSTVETTIPVPTTNLVKPEPVESPLEIPVDPSTAGTCEELEELLFQHHQDLVDLADMVPFYYLSNYGFSYISPHAVWVARAEMFNGRFRELGCEMDLEIILERVDEFTARSRSGEFLIETFQGNASLPITPSSIDPATARMQADPEPVATPADPSPSAQVDPQTVETCEGLEPLYLDHYQGLVDLADGVPFDQFEAKALAAIGPALEVWQTRLFFIEFRGQELACTDWFGPGALPGGNFTAKTQSGELLIEILQG